MSLSASERSRFLPGCSELLWPAEDRGSITHAGTREVLNTIVTPI